MNEDEERRFWACVYEYIQYVNMRKGQAYMNALSRVAPELYHEATGSLTLDCFYRDEKIPALLEWLGVRKPASFEKAGL